MLSLPEAQALREHPFTEFDFIEGELKQLQRSEAVTTRRIVANGQPYGAGRLGDWKSEI